MSKAGLARVLGEALVDRNFLGRLKENPRTVAKELESDLTEKELQFLEQVDYGSVESLATKLDISYGPPDEKYK
jgi:hypothetical protein